MTLFDLISLLQWPRGIYILKYFIYLFLDRGEGREREKEGEREGEKHQRVVALMRSLLGNWPATQACALTGNQTCHPLVCRPVLNPLSHTSQGKILSLSLTFAILIMMCLGVGLFSATLFGDSLCFLDLHVYFLHQIREIFFPIFSNRFPISCSF